MKKNLISIIILALLIVNIVLTSIMMFSVTSTNKKTADVVTKIAVAMDMDILSTPEVEGAAPDVAIADVVPYNIVDPLTIPLKKGADGELHYLSVAVTLSMDSTHEDYKDMGATVTEKESLIKGTINDIVGRYTLEEVQADQEGVKQAVLEGIQTMFGSTFIYQVTFSDVKYQ